jgi:hypothetical protein
MPIHVDIYIHVFLPPERRTSSILLTFEKENAQNPVE